MKKAVVLINEGGLVEQYLAAARMALQGYYLAWVWGNELHFWPVN